MLEAKPPTFPDISPKMLSQDSHVPVSTPGLFQASNIDAGPFKAS